MNEFLRQLTELVGEEQVKTAECMSAHTTFRVGGPADYFVEPKTVEALAGVINLCRKMQMPYMILGNGSNLLVGDKGYRGVMITLGRNWADITVEGTQIRAGAGAMLSVVSRQALKNALTGLEFAAGIPGTIGGAVFMNAGAYGSDMSAVLTSVTVLTPAGCVEIIPACQMELGYRTSCVEKKGYVVLEAELELAPGNEEEIRLRMDDLTIQRKTKQPLEYPSAGSTFKRPEGYFAGKLIQDAGLRGYRVGGAQISEKHCGFVINCGGATAEDIMNLCRDVQEKVRETFGVTLEMEVRTIGEF
ncbi:MAG: UDP-N-acetylmuramate dehydrogenase [Brotaphodocola sp.]